ncbi:MAG: sugar transferase [Anaerolineae bacterium]|nr:sugar transferase [Anaerolineae bacterium]
MESRRQNIVLIVTLVALDSLMILTGWLFAYHLRIQSDILPFNFKANFVDYRNVVLVSLPLWLGIFALCRLYNREELLGGPQEYGNVVKGCLIGFAALIAVSTFLRVPDLARGWLLIGLVLTTFLVGLARFLTRRVFYSLRGRGWFVQRALIVGANDDARAIARQLTPFGRTGVNVVGFVDDYLPVNTPVVENLRVVGATSNLHAVTLDQKIDQVILVAGAMTWESFDQLLRGITLANKDTYAIKVSPGLYETLTTGVRVSYKNRVPLLEIERAPITGIDALLKTGLDLTIGALMFLLALPIAFVITLALLVVGRRPLVEASPVLGKNGDTFRTYRFSSLRPDSEPWTRGQWVGCFLFETGLEKLPQLWNVVTGKMSLVGPRPVDPSQAEQYSEWLSNLLALKPGMTGARAASVKNVITLEQEMLLELYYARNYSIWLDLQLLFQTLVRIIKRERVVRQPNDGATATATFWNLRAMSPSQREF